MNGSFPTTTVRIARASNRTILAPCSLRYLVVAKFPKQTSDSSEKITSVVTARSAVRSAAVTLNAQVAKFVLGLALTAVLARLLTPADYGLVAMVAVITGFVGIFKDGGLTIATVQRVEVTHGQVSTLFWINSALGLLLALLVIALSPLAGWLYQDERLVLITVGLSIPFLFGGIAAQPTALLQREMRFGAIAFIEIASLVLSGAVGVAAALAGWGSWALVIMAITIGMANAILVFAFCRWRPSFPSRGNGVRSMLRFGGALTINKFMDVIASSLDVILLGRLFSPAAVGLYVRAQTLMLQPLTQLMAPLQLVALPLFSSLSDTPEKLRQSFNDLLMVTAIASSFMTAFLVLGADWIVRIFLGEQWADAATILRLLFGPTLTLPLTSVCVLLLTSMGRGRALVRWGLVRSSITALAILLGISWGPNGVALALSISFVAVLWPFLSYFLSRECSIPLSDIATAVCVTISFSSFSVAILYSIRISLMPVGPVLSLVMLGIVNLVLHGALVLAVPPCRRSLFRVTKIARDGLLPERS